MSDAFLSMAARNWHDWSVWRLKTFNVESVCDCNHFQYTVHIRIRCHGRYVGHILVSELWKVVVLCSFHGQCWGCNLFRTKYELVWECLSEIPATFFSGAASLMIIYHSNFRRLLWSRPRMLSHDLTPRWVTNGPGMVLAGLEFSTDNAAAWYGWSNSQFDSKWLPRVCFRLRKPKFIAFEGVGAAR